ncbi:hypothetical protein Pint_21293 [Pistacia integerrima]|uniref:Uncharacterized protein n=1 Tax=Pistacia integerrima TaxID=434235 RepID=A0ACC0XEP7_9ROSI|nr:hypothetical protein Pint_21293 [Pistacia integerrima]
MGLCCNEKYGIGWRVFEPLQVSVLPDSKHGRSRFCGLLPVISVLCLILLIGSTVIAPDHEMYSIGSVVQKLDVFPSKFKGCKAQCRPPGSEKLPEGIVSKTTNLDMRPLWGFPQVKNVG